jgi:hypothetical protein
MGVQEKLLVAGLPKPTAKPRLRSHLCNLWLEKSPAEISAEDPRFLETEVARSILSWRPDDEMIQKLDLQQASAFSDTSC